MSEIDILIRQVKNTIKLGATFLIFMFIGVFILLVLKAEDTRIQKLGTTIEETK